MGEGLAPWAAVAMTAFLPVVYSVPMMTSERSPLLWQGGVGLAIVAMMMISPVRGGEVAILLGSAVVLGVLARFIGLWARRQNVSHWAARAPELTGWFIVCIPLALAALAYL